jgi:hypothetical protein
VSAHLDESIRELIKLIVCDSDRHTFKGLPAALDRLLVLGTQTHSDKQTAKNVVVRVPLCVGQAQRAAIF